MVGRAFISSSENLQALPPASANRVAARRKAAVEKREGMVQVERDECLKEAGLEGRQRGAGITFRFRVFERV
jgi:hypothetical protein